MVSNAFEHRSGRVISLGRLVLAAVFLLAVWIDPSQPIRYPREGYVILGCYLAASIVYLVVTWNDWWLESRLALWAHIIDIFLFGAMVLLIDGYTSPFFTFFVFIILSAAIKWRWRETALTAAAVILLFFLGGLVSLYRGQSDLDLTRLLIRSTYVIVLSLVLIWFGMNQRRVDAAHSRGLDLMDLAVAGAVPLRSLAEHVAARTGAGRVVVALADREEPWIDVLTSVNGHSAVERWAHKAPEELSCTRLPFIFDSARRRLLSGTAARARRRSGDLPFDKEFADRFRLDAGIAIPIETNTNSGCIFALEVPGLCADDLGIGEEIRIQATAVLERAAVIGLSDQAAAARTRLSLARDIHDGVIQLLAGTVFRLKAIRNGVESARDVSEELKSLEQELVAEQQELRDFIGQLRSAAASESTSGAVGEIHTLSKRLERQWNISCELVRAPAVLRVSDTFRHALQQLIREAVANAVRHGGASRVELFIDSGESGVSLIVADDGRGFDNADGDPSAAARPWSLNERVHELGGSLALSSSPRGSRITVTLPNKSRL